MLVRCLFSFLVTVVTSWVFASDDDKSVLDSGTSEVDGLRSLALDRDRDWVREAQLLDANGTDSGKIYEALFARFSLTKDVDSLVAVYAIVKEKGIEMPVGSGCYFSDEDAKDGFIAGLEALLASRWGDVEALRSYSREAYLKNRYAFALLELEDALEDAKGGIAPEVAAYQFGLETQLLSSRSGKVSIGKLTEGKKGLYLDFWASWCGPCIRAMPELKLRAAAYEKQGLVVAGVNTDSSDAKRKSLETQKRFSLDIPWLIEPEEEPFSGPLRITSIPRVILLDAEGKVRFNGHPEDLGLKLALLDLGIAP